MKHGEENSTAGEISREQGTVIGGERILFLGAHCDDIEIGCGGTAARLARSRAIAFAIAADCGPNRKDEARTAAAQLGLAESAGNLFFGFIPDNRLEERKDVLQNWLKELVARFTPDTVFVHRGDDTHPDHEALYKVALRVFVHQAIYLYPIPKLAAQATAFQANCYVDISAFIRAKLALCACHASQAGKGIYLDPEQIKATACNAHVTGFGKTGGYAEAFRIHVTRAAAAPPPGTSPTRAAAPEGQGGRPPSGPAPGDSVPTAAPTVVPEAKQGRGADKAALRAALNGRSHGEILEIGAEIEVGLSPAMDKAAAIAALLDWASTPERWEALRRAIGGAA